MDVGLRPAVGSREVVLISTDDEVLDHVLTVTAAVGLEPTVIDDPRAVRSVWADATMIIIGADAAERLLPLGLARRPEVYVVGPVARQPEMAGWSGPLGATVVALPDAAGWLSGPLSEVSGTARNGRTVAVVGGCGGAGASTFAVALAGAGVRRGLSTFLIDADPAGGGLDLLLGAEGVPGWRWSRLARARGLVGDLRGHVVGVDGLDLLSHEREAADPEPEALTAVLSAARRSHQLVVVDLGRAALSEPAGAVATQVDEVLIVVPARLRAVAAARHTARVLAARGAVPWVVVRQEREAGPTPEAVVDGLQRPLLIRVPEDPAVPRAAERGEPPGRAGRGRLGRAAAEALEALLPAPAPRRRGERGRR